MSDVEVVVALIDRLRAKLKRKPSGYVQDQLAKAQAELRRRLSSQSDIKESAMHSGGSADPERQGIYVPVIGSASDAGVKL